MSVWGLTVDSDRCKSCFHAVYYFWFNLVLQTILKTDVVSFILYIWKQAQKCCVTCLSQLVSGEHDLNLNHCILLLIIARYSSLPPDPSCWTFKLSHPTLLFPSLPSPPLPFLSFSLSFLPLSREGNADGLTLEQFPRCPPGWEVVSVGGLFGQAHWKSLGWV